MTVPEMIACLEAERISRGLDQTEVSALLGYGGNAVWRWENRIGRIKLDSFVDWANGLGYAVKLEKIK